MELFALLEQLNAAHGPAGDEGGIREVIERLARPYADEITTDPMGSLIVRKKGTGPKVMFAAHMDSIGFIVTHIEKEGFLRVGRLGGISPSEAVYTPVRFKNGVQGVFVPEEKADSEKLKLDECYLDIGAKDEAEAKSMVQVGDTAVYNTPLYRNGSKVVSPYMDNRIACAVLLAALAQMSAPANDLYFVFTVQEEVGLRGAKTAAWSVDPDYGVAVDVEQWEEDEERGQTIIHAVIYVARPMHKAMVIGRAGASIKKIGSEARQEIQELLEGKVHLELWVKVREHWTEDAAFLRDLGLMAE